MINIDTNAKTIASFKLMRFSIDHDVRVTLMDKNKFNCIFMMMFRDFTSWRHVMHARMKSRFPEVFVSYFQRNARAIIRAWLPVRFPFKRFQNSIFSLIGHNDLLLEQVSSHHFELGVC